MRIKSFIAFTLILGCHLLGQELKVENVEPPNWWTGMNLNKIQLMIYGQNLFDVEAQFNSDAIEVLNTTETESGEYLFVDIEIKDFAAPLTYALTLTGGDQETGVTFKLYRKSDDPGKFNGFGPGDAIYLLMPDRFANGDPKNDFVEGYQDDMQDVEFQKRYGGDIKGVVDHLKYIKDLGFSTIWLNPVVENNMFRSYHGYAATDFYKVDPRLGTNDLYFELVEKAHSSGLKIIMDHVANHIGINHPWIKSLPMPDWINGTPDDFLPADHSKMEFTDLYADSAVINRITRGWFVDYMPDLNHGNPFVQKYIIQNTIWWIESSGLDGIREDTYAYCGQRFMSDWAKAILDEYPRFNILGENWTGEPAFLAGYQTGSPFNKLFDSNLPSVTDFAFRDISAEYVSGKKGLDAYFNLFAKDYLYADPENLVTFLDNHDVGRIFYYANGNLNRVKIAMTILLTTRGIPQILYGTELGMVANEDHGRLRMPFPGGFPGDGRNAFTREGRTASENEIFDFLKNLLQLRQKYPALAKGKMTHFPTHGKEYFYVKELNGEKLLVVINDTETEREIDLSYLSRHLFPGSELINLNTGSTVNIEDKLRLSAAAESAEIYLIKK